MIYFQDDRITLRWGNVLDEIKEIPDNSVHCVVTSPPYYGLRDYQTATWQGGDEKCDHRGAVGTRTDRPSKGLTGSLEYVDHQSAFRGNCKKCGAVRIDDQIGLEETYQEYVAKMVSLFREIRRVLREDGTLFLNVGDSYSASGRGGGGGSFQDGDVGTKVSEQNNKRAPADGFKEKCLMMIPARLAIALMDDGWYLRGEIIWHKTTPMPESVKDRPTKAHEMVYLLTKSPTYHYDWEAIATDAKEQSIARAERGVSDENKLMDGSPGQSPHSLHQPRPNLKNTARIEGDLTESRHGSEYPTRAKVNARDVWTLGPESFAGAHFATMPTELARRCLLAGTPKKVCKCGMPYEYEYEYEGSNWEERKAQGHPMRYGMDADKYATMGQSAIKRRKIIKSCQCEGDETMRAVVLDPFNGAATTGFVARELGFDYIGIDLNKEYLEISKKRLAQNVLF